jgi:hypothetical protein
MQSVLGHTLSDFTSKVLLSLRGRHPLDGYTQLKRLVSP